MMAGDEFYDDEMTSGLRPEDQRGTPCTRAGHVHGCAGIAGGEHELQDGWIAIEQPDGTVVEIEVAAA